MRTDALIAALAALATRVAGEPPAGLAGIADELRQLEATCAGVSERELSGGTDGASARRAVDAGQVAIRLGIAAKALATASAERDDRVVAINRSLAQASVLDALAPLGRRIAAGEAQAPWPGATATAPPARATPAAAHPPRADLLTNITRYHREHERFYVQDRTFVAADLHREANKLKVVAEAWARHPACTPDPEIDFADPAHAPVGCADLNELNAIALVGVLFMEGEGEPIELKVLKGRLTALAAAWRRAGEWLSAKMEAAWERERAMYQPAYLAVAHARFNTIVVNWRGSRERLLAARVLEMALRTLDAIPFEPQPLRADLPCWSRRLAEAAAMLAAAAQLVGRTAADLADNDPHWTDCIRHLEAAAR